MRKISLLVLCIWLCCSGLAIAQEVTPIGTGQVTLSWDANTDIDLAGYQLYHGPTSGNYDTVINVGNQTFYTVTGLEVGKAYHFVLTAYDTSKNESGYSNEATGNAKDGEGPKVPTGLKEVIQELTIIAKKVNIITTR